MSEPMCRTRGQVRKKSKSVINIIDYFFHNNRKYCCHANIFAVVLLCESVFQKLYFLTVSHLKTPLFRVFSRYICVPCKYICAKPKFRVQIYLTFRTHFPGFIPLSFEKRILFHRFSFFLLQVCPGQVHSEAYIFVVDDRIIAQNISTHKRRVLILIIFSLFIDF